MTQRYEQKPTVFDESWSIMLWKDISASFN